MSVIKLLGQNEIDRQTGRDRQINRKRLIDRQKEIDIQIEIEMDRQAGRFGKQDKFYNFWKDKENPFPTQI